MSSQSELLRSALRVLRIDRFVLAVHDASFPSTPEEDVGRGSPYGRGALHLLELAAELGFDALQLGPQGDTSLANPSPYDGALFTRSPMSLALATLDEDPAWAPLTDGLLAPLVSGRPEGPPEIVQYEYAWAAARQALAALHARFRARRQAGGELDDRFRAFVATNARTLAPDGLWEALVAEHGTDDSARWPATDQHLLDPAPDAAAAAASRREELRGRHAEVIERHAFAQFALATQHQLLRAQARRLGGLRILGDLQIGLSPRDVWSCRALFRKDYLMGAPPSRTNPAGQPWGYPVFDPMLYRASDGAPGPVLELIVARVDRMLADLDGLRIDHPHGLVCPWVYAAADPDPVAAVGRGARLFASPNLPDHPALQPLAIPRPDQLSTDPGLPRYADGWVRALEPEQVERYGLLFDAVMARVAAAGRARADVVCEVLSTWPYPLRRVMERHALGRFCVTQKADVARRDDVYRSDNVSEADWIMVGNHDTPPVWALAEAWHGTAVAERRAAFLTERLLPDPAHATTLRPRLGRWLLASPRHLCQGMLAELFASRARHVSIFFSDLFGLREIYNRPGLVDERNWRLRLPSDFRARYLERLRDGDAFNVPLALALAMMSKGRADGAGAGPLAGALLDAARELTPSLAPEIAAVISAAL